MAKSHAPTARQAFDRLALTSRMHYLDVGCGNGYTVRWAADLVDEGKAVGIDVATNMIERAKAITGDDERASFFVTPFPEHELSEVLVPGGFDRVFSMEVFYYLPDVDAGMREVARLLKPGGRFACVIDFYAENEASHSWPADLDCSMTLLSEAQWREAFEGAGLTVIEQTRLTQPPSENVDDWKVEVGSLLTLGERLES